MASSEAEDYHAPEPHKVIGDDHVTAALKEDKGPEAKLISWRVQDFSDAGLHLSCSVTTVEIKYLAQGEVRDVTYIVKLNPGLNIPGYHEFMMDSFVQEAGFYLHISPEMNSILVSLGLPALNVPKCFYASKEIGEQMIFLEDLRPKGFKPFDVASKEFDLPHMSLALEAIARFHAASYLLMKKHPDEDLNKRFEQPKGTHPYDLMKLGDLFNNMFRTGIECTNAMLVHAGGYEKRLNWMKPIRESPSGVLFQLPQSTPPFDVLCHSDLGAHNLLFRYDDKGNPVDIMLVDLQGARVAPGTNDLIYLIYISVPSQIRKSNKDAFLASYVETFRAVVQAGREEEEDIPFSLQEYRQAFKDKQTFGLFMCMIKEPSIGVWKGERLDAQSFFGAKTKDQVEGMIRKCLEFLESNPQSKPNIFGVFEEMEADGTFD